MLLSSKSLFPLDPIKEVSGNHLGPVMNLSLGRSLLNFMYFLPSILICTITLLLNKVSLRLQSVYALISIS